MLWNHSSMLSIQAVYLGTIAPLLYNIALEGGACKTKEGDVYETFC